MVGSSFSLGWDTPENRRSEIETHNHHEMEVEEEEEEEASLLTGRA